MNFFKVVITDNWEGMNIYYHCLFSSRALNPHSREAERAICEAITADEKALLTKQRVKKRQRQANKDISSTRSKEKHSGLGPTRSSPRFHVVSSCDNQKSLGSLQSVEIEKNEENNGTCVANTVTGRISRKVMLSSLYLFN